jgi:outer membrane protein assembly factor BamB
LSKDEPVSLSSQPLSASPTGLPVRRRRLLPPWWVALLLLAVVQALAVFQLTEWLPDPALSNILTMMIGFVGLLIFLGWFVLFCGVRPLIKFGSLGLVAAGIGVFFLFYRFDHFTGNMRPMFVPRFGSVAELPEASDVAVDLATTTPNDFPQFLGPHRSLTVDSVRLANDWSKHRPKLIWKKEKFGEGLSGFAVVNGNAVTMEQYGDQEMVTCYDVKTGRLQWLWHHTARFESPLARNGPRSTPAIHQGKVYALGATGKFVCLDGANGKLLWQHDLLDEFGISPQEESQDLSFGRANSPLIVDDLVVIPIGGSRANRVTLAAFDKNTGKLAWKGGEHHICYSSPALAKLAGVEQILIVNEDTVSGHDPRTGKQLWEFEWPGHSSQDANSSQAVPVAPDKVFVSKGYGQGAALYQLKADKSGKLTPKELWHKKKVLLTKFTNVAMRDGYVYGLSNGVLECIELKTGERQWREGRYGHGQVLLVGDLLLVLTEEGMVVLVEATPENSNRVLGQFDAVEGTTWNNLALYGRYLLVRNSQQAACFELPLEGE